MTSQIEEKDPRFKYLETKVGLVALLALLGIVALLVFVGREKDLFTKKFNVNFVAKNGRGISIGMPVKFSGFKVGKVKYMELEGGAVVMVTMEINRKYQKWMRVGARARLIKEGFIGEPFIEITGGHEEKTMLEEGALMPFERRAGIEELINAAKPALNEIKEMIHYANNPEGDMKSSLANIRALSAELMEARHELSSTIRETNALIKKSSALMDTVGDEGGPILASTKNILTNLEGISSKLVPVMERMEKISERAEEATATIPSTAVKIESVLDNLETITGVMAAESSTLRQTLFDAKETIGETKEVIRGVKRSWPVKLMVPPLEGPELLPLDAFPDRSGYYEDFE